MKIDALIELLKNQMDSVTEQGDYYSFTASKLDMTELIKELTYASHVNKFVGNCIMDVKAINKQ